MTTEELIRKINWSKLKDQKEVFMNMIRDWGEADDPQQKADAVIAEGLLTLIDNIQDHAVDALGIPESEVFNLIEK